MNSQHEMFMRIALEEAQKGMDEGNDAVGSIIVCDGEVVARGRNLVRTTNDPTAHAETVALRNGGTNLGRSDFSGCTLYTTFEPCPMCTGALMNSGIAAVVLGGRPGSSTRFGDYIIERLVEMAKWGDRLEVVTGILVDECTNIRGI